MAKRPRDSKFKADASLRSEISAFWVRGKGAGKGAGKVRARAGVPFCLPFKLIIVFREKLKQPKPPSQRQNRKLSREANCRSALCEMQIKEEKSDQNLFNILSILMMSALFSYSKDLFIKMLDNIAKIKALCKKGTGVKPGQEAETLQEPASKPAAEGEQDEALSSNHAIIDHQFEVACKSLRSVSQLSTDLKL